MADSAVPPDGLSPKAELKKLLEDILISMDDAPEHQHKSLINTLRKWQNAERRRHPRKNCSIPVRVGMWQVFTERIRNISMGGVFIKTSAPVSHGEHVTLIFSLPNKAGPVKINGHVVWKAAEGVGVEFKEPLGEELKQVIGTL
ncbi:MAG: PilZ domain-containing protein [Thermodesulfobacteriota bacterium]|nr:PilZ domain-containing protein [Thermodesulfobacteriota bacterium]